VSTKQLTKTEFKKSEPSNASTLDPASDFQPISVASITQSISVDSPLDQQLLKIQQSLDQIQLEFSIFRIQATMNSDYITQLKHDTSDLRDTIHNVRGFYRELLLVTSDFKKDVHDYLGCPSSFVFV